MPNICAFIKRFMNYGLSNEHLVLGIAAALRFRSDDDEQAVRMQELLSRSSMHAAVKEITSLEDAAVVDAIISSCQRLIQ